MQILKPIVHETVWGGKKLAKFVQTDCNNIGHLYAVIDTKAMCSTFLTGPYAGKTIHEWFEDNKERFGLARYRELPILMALVEAADNLSIQVHPDDSAAALLEGKPFGKNESFFLLEPPASGRLYNGTLVKTRDELKALIDEGRTLEGVDTVAAEAGDYIYIEGGTLHAASAGSLSFEIEENCDCTFRFYDFDRLDKNGRKRPLQVEKALASLHPEKQSGVTKLVPNVPKRERMYELTLVEDKKSYACTGDMFTFITWLKGEKNFDGVAVRPGTAVLLEPNEAVDVEGCVVMAAKPIAP